MTDEHADIAHLLEGFAPPAPDPKHLDALLRDAAPLLAAHPADESTTHEQWESSTATVLMFSLAACALAAVMYLTFWHKGEDIMVSPMVASPLPEDGISATDKFLAPGDEEEIPRIDTAPRKRICDTYDNGHPFYEFMDVALDAAPLDRPTFKALLKKYGNEIEHACGINPTGYYQYLDHMDGSSANPRDFAEDATCSLHHGRYIMKLSYSRISSGAMVAFEKQISETDGSDLEVAVLPPIDIATRVEHSKYSNLTIPFAWENKFYVLGLEGGVNYLAELDPDMGDILNGVADRPLQMADPTFAVCDDRLPVQRFMRHWLHPDTEKSLESLYANMDKFRMTERDVKGLNAFDIASLPHLDAVEFADGKGMQTTECGYFTITMTWDDATGTVTVEQSHKEQQSVVDPNTGKKTILRDLPPVQVKDWSNLAYLGSSKKRAGYACRPYLFVHKDIAYVICVEPEGRYLLSMKVSDGTIVDQFFPEDMPHCLGSEQPQPAGN